MKKIFSLIFIFSTTLINAQTVADTIDFSSREEAIAHVFGSLDTTHYPSNILLNIGPYDSRLDFADGSLNDSVFSVYDWYFMHQNLYYSSRHTPTTWYSLKQLDSIVRVNTENNILPIGIIDFNVHQIKDSAFFDGSIDVVDNAIIEATEDSTKIYQYRKLFNVAVMNITANTLEPTFKILPSLYFSNDTAPLEDIFIDFDDGYGYRQVYVNQNLQLNYPDGGHKIITSRITKNNGDTLYSRSEVYLNDPDAISLLSGYINYDYSFEEVLTPSEFPTTLLDFPAPSEEKKAKCGVWLGCGNNQIRKPIIICGGYNPKDGKSLKPPIFTGPLLDLLGPIWPIPGWRGTYYETYNGVHTEYSSVGNDQPGSTNGNDMLEKLKREGYDIILVQFEDGIGYVQYNAVLIAKIIRTINIAKWNAYNPGADLDPEDINYPNPLLTGLKHASHENIVMGYSAGALGSRMGLTLMEQTVRYGPHHTRIWVSVDGEHQGSNVPIGFQMFNEFIELSPAANPVDMMFKAISTASNEIIKTDGVATQNLLYHISKLNFAHSTNDNISWDIDHNADFIDYLNTLLTLTPGRVEQLIGYPLQLRRIAIAQGSTLGHINNLGSAGSPPMLSYKAPQLFCGPGIGFRNYREVTSYFMPNVVGNSESLVLRCKIGMVLRLGFLTIPIKWPDPIFGEKSFIAESNPYDIMPGSTLTSHLILADKTAALNSGFLGFLGCTAMQYKNPAQHGFCPTVSAFDMYSISTNNWPRSINFSLTPLNQGLLYKNSYGINGLTISDKQNFGYPHITHPNNIYEVTPFDAVCGIGIPNEGYLNNQMHVEDPDISMSDFLVEEVAPYKFYLANRTIGSTAKYRADFEAREQLIVGDGKIYNPNSALTTSYTQYDRELTPDVPFIIEANGVVNMRSKDDQNGKIVLAPGFSAKNGSIFRAYIYKSQEEALCDAYTAGRLGQSKSQIGDHQLMPVRKKVTTHKTSQMEAPGQTIVSSVEVFPNPSEGSFYIMIKNTEPNAQYTFEITDINGKLVNAGVVHGTGEKLDLNFLEKGFYILTIKGNDHYETRQLILQ